MEQKLRRDRKIGDNLRTLRDKHGISQEKLCAELQRRGCDIARSAYAKYENGELNVKVSVIIELRKIYGCNYDDFFAGLDVSEMNKQTEKSIGYNIRNLREQKGYAQELFATKLQLEGVDITRSAVAKIEVGQKHIYPDEMIAIKKVPGVSFDEIFNYES